MIKKKMIPPKKKSTLSSLSSEEQIDTCKNSEKQDKSCGWLMNKGKHGKRKYASTE